MRLILGVLFCILYTGCVSSGDRFSAHSSEIRIEPHSIELRDRTDLGRFVLVRVQGGYSLLKPDGAVIAECIRYQKAFGGRIERIRIHLIEDRFLAYPVTVDDAPVAGSGSYDLVAVVRVYDLRDDVAIYEGPQFRYGHDIPLLYDVMDAIHCARQ